MNLHRKQGMIGLKSTGYPIYMRPEKYLLFFTAYNREGRMNLRRKTGYNLVNINRTISVRPAKHMLLFTVYIQQGG